MENEESFQLKKKEAKDNHNLEGPSSTTLMLKAQTPGLP